MTRKKSAHDRRTTSPADDDRRRIDDFMEAASAFRGLCDNAKEHGRKRFLFGLSQALPRLQAVAAALPEVEAVSGKLPFEAGDRPRRDPPDVVWTYLPDDWTYVQELFHETVDGAESPAIHLLGDDLGDIYDEVVEGFDIIAGGFPESEAVWHWRWGFWNHWGFHIAEAQRVIHYYVAVHAHY
ncbi:MAG: DUF5063 domain-containing protein [Gaiellaceae bacterium]